MKNLKIACLIILIIFFGSIGYADVVKWMPANQLTLAWNGVTTTGDGSSFPEGLSIEYEVVMAETDKTNPVVLWTGPETRATITLSEFGRFIFGVNTLLIDNGERVAESDFAWSDDPAVVEGDTFGALYYKPPAKVTGFHRKIMLKE